MTVIIADKFFKITKRNKFLYWLSGGSSQEKKILKTLHDFTDSVIRKRRDELEKRLASNKDINVEEDDLGRKTKLALLDVLLQSTIDGKPLSNLDIREEVDTFVFEGIKLRQQRLEIQMKKLNFFCYFETTSKYAKF